MFWVIVVSFIVVVIIGIGLITYFEKGIRVEDINIENLNNNGDNVLENPKNQDEKISENPNHQNANISANPTQQEVDSTENNSGENDEVYHTEYNRVKIKLISDVIGFKATDEFETTNHKIVAYIDNVLRGGEVSVEEDLSNNVIRYAIVLSNRLSESGCELYYDKLNNKAYFGRYKEIYEVDVNFARYIDSFLEYTDIDVNIDDTDAVALFKTYGWTLNYKINSMEQEINNINTLAVFDSNAYYFAYNNVLSKDIGLDMTGYSNTSDITVDIYRVNESMPYQFYPIQNGRAIVIKDGNKIIGAFISAGRHSAFNACSLKGNSFEEVTGQSVHEWLADMVIADEFEEGVSTLEPEQVIEEYFLALDKKDANAAQYYISKVALLDGLTTNMLNKELFNEDVILPLSGDNIGVKSRLSNLKSAKLIDIKLIDDSNTKIKIFDVTMDMKYIDEGIYSSGDQFWNCYMVYESPQTGWKIFEFGH